MASQVVMHQPTEASHDPEASISLNNFRWGEVDSKLHTQTTAAAAAPPPPPLGVLSAFHGNFSGTGLNMIFRPNSGPPKGTTFTNPITPAAPTPPSENVLEINLTTETLKFADTLGSVPNRGLEGQQDIFLNGVPYFQSVNDVTNFDTGKADGQPQGIHAEPGVWMHVPASTDPAVGASLVRMGSIPHGTTINAQALESSVISVNSGPIFPKVDITPFIIGTNPPKKVPAGTFVAQTAKNVNSPRIPQDLTKFIAAKTITQEILDDPNTVLATANKGKNIVKTQVFTVSTDPTNTILGGGTANIAFLSDPGTKGPNANAASMTATFWINTVQSIIRIPTLRPGQSVRIAGAEPQPGARVPTFAVKPPTEGSAVAPTTEARQIVVTHTEIQYSQQVNLNFAGLTWPHISVATLVPTTDQVVPPHVLHTPNGDIPLHQTAPVHNGADLQQPLQNGGANGADDKRHVLHTPHGDVPLHQTAPPHRGPAVDEPMEDAPGDEGVEGVAVKAGVTAKE
ncbi:hypothetical protein LTR78_002569 [Recurvomyces mirabilis]|uniref:Uncharacterized protein n=1 Tax=Recurvomyces mirabilis TaxID=574656 RepID=A0AAE0WTG6_9PEZI|nr:hypothetical protein LTR78_002569 [Recurvomyces mirabilis]KAK5157498.1 hypothetical protein LTS14_004263 [Recurvomyces mirabilis]